MEIELTRGQKAIVDPEDYDFLVQWKWFCTDRNRAARSISNSRHSETIYMHRVVAQRAGMAGLVDHKSCNSLDNRRCNLRPCTRAQNNVNRGKLPGGRNSREKMTSRFKGVSFRSEKKRKWACTISFNGNRKWLGYFDNEETAAKAYNAEAIQLHGEFAVTNFPQ